MHRYRYVRAVLSPKPTKQFSLWVRHWPFYYKRSPITILELIMSTNHGDSIRSQTSFILWRQLIVLIHPINWQRMKTAERNLPVIWLIVLAIPDSFETNIASFTSWNSLKITLWKDSLENDDGFLVIDISYTFCIDYAEHSILIHDSERCLPIFCCFCFFIISAI